MNRFYLVSVLLISCSSPESSWNCPNPELVQAAALECEEKTRMYGKDCYDNARQIYCSRTCIANCGEAKMSGGPVQIKWLPDGGAEK